MNEVQISLRMDKELKKRLESIAREQNRSLNNLINTLLIEATKGEKEMSEYVFRTEEPIEYCYDCPINNQENGRCRLGVETSGCEIPKKCSLREVPTHGDLIDRQKLLEHRFEVYDNDEEVCEDYIETYHVLEAPTIIEASTSPAGFCNTEGCSNSKTDMSKAQNHICPYYQGVCSLDKKIICYCQHHYEMCDKFIEASKERE